MDDDPVYAFAAQFRQLSELVHQRLPPADQVTSDLLDVLADHLGQPARELPVVSDTFPPYDHVNVQVAIDAWRAGHGEGELIGVAGPGREHHSLTELLA